MIKVEPLAGSNGLFPPITVAAESLAAAKQRLVPAEVADLETVLLYLEWADAYAQFGFHKAALPFIGFALKAVSEIVASKRSQSDTGGNAEVCDSRKENPDAR